MNDTNITLRLNDAHALANLLRDERDRALARVAELDAAALRNDEQHAEAMRAVRLRAERAEDHVTKLETAARALLRRLVRKGHIENHGHRKRGTGCVECREIYALADAAKADLGPLPNGEPDVAPPSVSEPSVVSVAWQILRIVDSPTARYLATDDDVFVRLRAALIREAPETGSTP